MAIGTPLPDKSTLVEGSAVEAPVNVPPLATSRWRALDVLFPPRQQRPLWALLIASFLLRMMWLVQPPDTLVFDESYYVSAARVLLGIPSGTTHYVSSPYGLDPNTEHPPLAKLIVAGSMWLFGDNPIGWRVPSVIIGTASILLVFGIACRLGTGQDIALLAAFLFAFDNLVFVHSRIFTLDIFQLGFMLLGLYWYISRRPALAGLGFALSALSKFNGFFGLAVIGGYELLRLLRESGAWKMEWRAPTRRVASATGVAIVVFLLLLGVMDRLWVGYSQPLQHVARILSYGTSLRRPDGPSDIESYPWQWLWNDRQISYGELNEEVVVGDQVQEIRPLVLFRGAMNPFVLQLWPFGLGFAAYHWWRRRPEGKPAALALAWFGGTYLPLVAAAILDQRISYIYYFLPAIPAIALAGSLFLLRSGVPKFVRWFYMAAVLLAFYGYFPFQFYPHWPFSPTT